MFKFDNGKVRSLCCAGFAELFAQELDWESSVEPHASQYDFIVIARPESRLSETELQCILIMPESVKTLQVSPSIFALKTDMQSSAIASKLAGSVSALLASACCCCCCCLSCFVS
jgi:hypothetical protein